MSPDPLSSGTQDGWAVDDVAGRRIDRFVLRRLLGRGGWGVVYQATDPQSGAEIALKVVPSRAQAVRDRVAREIVALEFANDPGIVRLLGHGSAPEGIWIAMTLVEGVHFPAGTWEQLAATVLALVETVAHMHGLGIIHRDLKPANILVRPDGRPVVLDFGLARGELLGEDLTREGAVLGTPRFQAPEQLEGQRVDDRADVYALGVLLYERLSGRFPHRGEDLLSLRIARALHSPTPLDQVAPQVPLPIAGLIRRMLAHTPEDRPSAAEIARALSGRPLPSDLRLDRLDGDELCTAIAARLSRGEAVDLWGPRRSGRTRMLEDIAARLPDAAYTAPSERPYASLIPVLGPLPDGTRSAVEAELTARLEALRGPLLVDDWATQDAWTRALLLRVALPCGQLRVRPVPGAVALVPASEATLAALFGGPERVLHLPSDAGALLHRRTGGWPGRVIDQLQRWTRQARIHRKGDRFSVDRDTLDTLQEEPVEAPPADAWVRGLPEEQEDVLLAARLGWPHANAAVISAILGRPRWEVEAQIEALEAQGCLAQEPLGLRARAEPGGRWAPERVRLAHGVLAAHLAEGAPGRLMHLLAAQEPAPLAAEIRAIAERLIARGQNRRAIRLLWTLRELVPAREDVAESLVALLLEQRTAEGLEQASFAIGAGRPDLRVLVEATRLSRHGDAAGVDALLGGAPPWRSPALAVLAASARWEAARRLPISEQESLLDRLERDPAVEGSAGGQARWGNWLGILRFRQKRFTEAAQVHEAAAPLRATKAERLTSLINAVRAWVEADGLDRAAVLAEEVRATAAALRLPNLEAQGAWLLRAVANRRAETAPDLELPAIIATLGDPVLSAQVTMTEAYLAWRGRHPEGYALASRAAAAFQEVNLSLGALHARVLAWACAPEGDPGPLVAEVLASTEPVLVLDSLALLAHAGARLRVSLAEIDALNFAQGGLRSPYPRGAFATEDALRRIHRSLESP